ncbi:DNA polymerase Y family protein [Crateriforma conspicua]|nr:DNA polymerase Y family protein [Crateriforma conspicua]
MKRLLCVWLPDWPIQRLRMRRDATSGDIPTVLWQNDPRRGRVVVACCRRATAAGVRLGMSVAQATDWLQRAGAPDSYQLIEHNRHADAGAMDQLVERFRNRLTPMIGTEVLDRFRWAGRSLHCRESLIGDLHGVTHLFGGESDVIAASDQILASLNLSGRIAIADTIGAAWAVANHGHGRTRIVPIGLTVDAVGDLPTSGLRIAPETVTMLRRLGVDTIGQTLALPRGGLATRLGQHVADRLAQLVGDVEEHFTVAQRPVCDSESMPLEYPTEDMAILVDRIGRLMEKVRAGLATRSCGALHVSCRLDLSVHPPLTVDVGLFAPTLDTGHWLTLVQQSIESQGLPAPVHRVTVSVPHTQVMATRQQDLFRHGDDSCGGSTVARLIDSLSNRLGRENVCGARLTRDALPEKAFEEFPLAGRSARWFAQAEKSSASSRSKDGHQTRSSFLPHTDEIMRRPLELFVTPHALVAQKCRPNAKCDNLSSSADLGREESDTGPWHHANARLAEHQTAIGPSGIPRGFQYAGQHHAVIRSWGPERIETGWWAGPCVRRDYFRVETNRGQWWWVYRDLTADTPKDTHEWWLHGIFS